MLRKVTVKDLDIIDTIENIQLVRINDKLDFENLHRIWKLISKNYDI